MPSALLLVLALPSCQPGSDRDTGLLYEGDERRECTDGADNDRDGLFDCDDPGCAGSPDCEEADTDADTDSNDDTGPTDADGDGWTVPGGDCDDASASVYPGAPEYPTDGIDQDCDGGDACYEDADGDGFGSTAVVPSTDLDCGDPSESRYPSDCDDTRTAVNPGAEEICENGLDDDCDGSSSPCGISGTFSVSRADAKLVGEGDCWRTGFSLAAGDVDGDAAADILVGSVDGDGGSANSGLVYLVPGPVSGTMALPLAEATIEGEVAGDYTGYALAVGDTNADGIEDIVVGSPLYTAGGDRAGAVGVLFGPLTGARGFSSSEAILVGEAAGHQAGWSVAVGDVDGDAVCDMIVGAPYVGVGGTQRGAAYIVHGPAAGPMSLSLAAATLLGDGTGDQAGWVLASDDVNGDGVDDIVVGAYGDDTSVSAYLVLGPASGTIDLSSADARLQRDDIASLMWPSVASGDVNGDGFADIVVGTPWSDTGGADSGAAWLVLGPVSGTWRLSKGEARLTGEEPEDWAGSSVTVGDLDADGFGDIVVGAHGADATKDTTGAVYIQRGPVTGTHDLSRAAARITGQSQWESAGSSVAAGDVDGDLYGDLLVGAPFLRVEKKSLVGGAYVFLGGGW